MSMEKLKQALKDKKLIFGWKRTLKSLKRGEIAEVFLAGNCPNEIRNEAKSHGVEIVELKEDSAEIAMLCKRTHNILAVSVLRQ